MLKLIHDNLEKISHAQGLKIDEINSQKEKISDFSQRIKNRKQGFYELPDQSVDEIKKFAAEYKSKYQHFVILGIGGSALGATCLRQALTHLFKPTKLHVIDNIDPIIFKELEEVIDLKKTLFLVISKSGDTPETLAQYDYFRAKTDAENLDPKSHFVFITDPQKGRLRKEATEQNIAIFDVPQNVGGRFSILSPVGLLPAALLDLDIDALLRGARNQRDKIFQNSDHAFTLAAIQYLLYQKGKIINVLMPYSQKLIGLADWYRQLLAESIGKKFNNEGNIINVGITPVNAVGVTDQHSQSQLYNEGPNDKLIIFIENKNFSAENLHDKSEFAEFKKLIHFEKEGTEEALTQNDRPNITIEIDNIDEETLGELFMFLEFSIAFLGEFFNINAFDQPGVELSKKLTREKLREFPAQ